MSPISETTADAVAKPPAPGPTSVIGAIASTSTVTAFVTPITWAIAVSFGTMVGCTRCSMPLSVLTATPRNFRRNRRYAFDIHGALVDLGAESQARQDRKLLRGIVALDVESGIGLGVTE